MLIEQGSAWVKVLIISLAISFMALAGCAGPSSEDIKVSDKNIFLPGLRATINLLPVPQEKTLLSDRSSDTHDGRKYTRKEGQLLLAGEVDFAYGEGKSSQQIGPGQFLNFENQRFDGPAQISEEYQLYVSSLAIPIGGWITDEVAIEGIFGWGFQYLTLAVKSGGIAKHDKTLTVGPSLGVQVIIQPLSWMSLYGRGGLTGGWIGSQNPVGFYTGELGAEVRFLPGVTIFGGWRWWAYEENRGYSDVADIDLDLSGPTIGLHFIF